MAKVKDSAAIAAKWARVTPMRTQDYEEGIRNPGKDWKAETEASNERYKAGVQAAIAKNRFAKGVAKAGTEKWQRKTIEKGTQNWGPGVASGKQDFEAGFAPFREVINSTALPPRFPKGDPRNIQRVSVLADALHKKKMEG